MSRLELYRKAGQPAPLPCLGAGGYMLEAMLMLGPMRSDGMGQRPADWPEIEAFARLTGRIEEPWEAEILFEMCMAYADEYVAASDPLRIPPMDRP